LRYEPVSDRVQQLTDRYDSLSRELENLEDQDALARAQKLLKDLRESGKDISDPEQRGILSSLARALGEMIFDASGKYPSVRLAYPVADMEALQTRYNRPEAAAYVEGGRALEEYVDATVQTYVDQVTSTADKLRDSLLLLLAVVVVDVLITSFIGSLVRNWLGPVLLLLGMIAYALYVFTFHFALGLRKRREEYEALKSTFENRRQGLEALVHEDWVDEVVGCRVDDSQARFERWLTRARQAYVALIGAAILVGVSALAVGLKGGAGRP
jgi:hypothetical protein